MFVKDGCYDIVCMCIVHVVSSLLFLSSVREKIVHVSTEEECYITTVIRTSHLLQFKHFSNLLYPPRPQIEGSKKSGVSLYHNFPHAPPRIHDSGSTVN